MKWLPARWLRRLWNLSTLSLVVLVLQNSLLAVMTRLSRTNVEAGESYHASTLVLNQEIVKMVACLLIFWHETQQVVLPGDARTATDVTVVTVGKGAFGGQEDQTGVRIPSAAATGLSQTLSARPHARLDPHASVTSTVAIAMEDSTDAPSQKPSRALVAHTRHCCAYFRTVVLTKDTMLLFVPAALFTFQNFAVFVSLTYLDAVSFQIWSQSKLLTAALFSVWMLNRHLSWGQWGSLFLLIAGVLVTQVGSPARATPTPTPTPTPGPNVVGDTAFVLSTTRQATPPIMTLSSGSPAVEPTRHMSAQQRHLIGVMSCLLSGISSSFAGVYFEKVVKTTAPSLAVRNIQLSLFGIPLAALTMMTLDIVPNIRKQAACGQTPRCVNVFTYCQPDMTHALTAPETSTLHCPVRPFYYWQRYDVWLTWGLVGIHALGGLLVALVFKYADNIVKGFATGISMVVSGLLSSMIWGYTPSVGFVFGSLLVAVSTVLFHKLDPKRPQP